MLRPKVNFLRNIKASAIFSSRAVSSTSTQDGSSVTSDTKFQHTNISTKYQNKLPKRHPLLKNFLVGVVDKELLAFPEVIARDDMAKLDTETAAVRNFFESASSGDEPDLKQLGLYGLNISQHLGGRGYTISESLTASRYENLPTDVASLLAQHRSVVDVLNEIGTDNQRDKYLPKLADGSQIACDAIFEAEVSPTKLFNTYAQHDLEDRVWNLNGEKSFIVNKNATCFFVLAQTDRLNVPNDMGTATTAFIVDANMPGVTVHGNRITFKNVLLRDENVLGSPYEGNQTAEVFVKYNRIRTSQVALELTKKTIKHLTQYCINTKQCGQYISDMNIVRDRLANLVNSAYAMESMLFYTAGLMDEFDGQDVVLEAAATKYYSTSHMWKAACASLEFLGPRTMSKGEPSEDFLRSASLLYTQGETMDSIRIYTALLALQHAGNATNEMIQKVRNPLFHPNFIFSKLLDKNNLDNPRVKLQLNEYLHPSLEPAAQCIELSIARIEMCVEILLTRYGNEVMDKQVEISRIAEMVATVYAMFTSVSRASRSYCIGLQLADHELLAASSICLSGRNRIKVLATELADGPAISVDGNLQRLSKQVLKSRGYYPVHPLTYNY